jgi:hypothetical protein
MRSPSQSPTQSIDKVYDKVHDKDPLIAIVRHQGHPLRGPNREPARADP